MTQPTALALAAGACLAVVSCDNEVELLSDDPGVAVVYGLVDGAADEQLLSVTRTFRFSDGGDALASARSEDSVYYAPDALAIAARNPRTGLTVDLERVDLRDRGIERPAGTFVTEPNVAYRYLLSDLGAVPGDSILITGTGAEGSGVIAPVFSAGSVLLAALEPRSTGSFQARYNLLADRNSTPFRWRRSAAGADPSVYEVGLEVYFTEAGASGEPERRVLYYPLLRNARAAELSSDALNVDNERFGGLYAFLATRLRADPAIRRRFEGVRGVITAGGPAYTEFQTVLAANTGITATQELPTFSNIDGGVGLVAAITRVRQPELATLSPASLDSLFQGSRTRDLNFCSGSAADCF